MKIYVISNLYIQCIYSVYTYDMTTLNIRIEEKIKVKANKTLSSLGLDMSTAVKIFLIEPTHFRSTQHMCHNVNTILMVLTL